VTGLTSPVNYFIIIRGACGIVPYGLKVLFVMLYYV
jgi:hypothetical protein